MMRSPVIVTTTALVTAIVAIWGTTVILAHSQKHPNIALASSIDVMQMMRSASALPEQTFDAY